MQPFTDLIQRLIPKSELGYKDDNTIDPNVFMQSQDINNDPRNIRSDTGQIVDYDFGRELKNTNPFAEIISKYAGGNGTLTGFLARLFDINPIRNTNMTDVSSTPAIRAGEPDLSGMMDRTPMKNAKPASLALTPAKPQASPYSQPSALADPQIEELRRSILEQTGQLDPNSPDPNSLAGRMSGPNSQVDQRNQMNEAQQQHDSLRGFDGSRVQRIKNKRAETEGSFQVAGDVQKLHPPGTFNSNTQKGDALNGLARELGVPAPQNVIPFPPRRIG